MSSAVSHLVAGGGARETYLHEMQALRAQHKATCPPEKGKASRNRDIPLNKPTEGIRKQREQRLLGKPLPDPSQQRLMDKIRKFDAEHRGASKALAVAGIIAVSATVGYLLNLAVDELAHLTSRKNDKVGMLVGTIVGMLLAVSHTSALFALPRRMEMRMGARDWWEDGQLPESQAWKIMEDNYLPLRMAMISNAKSLLGIPWTKLRIMHCDMMDTLNYIQRHNIPKSQWLNYMDEYDHAPKYGQAYFQAQQNVPSVGIRQGKYYVCKFDSANAILQRDWNNSFKNPQTQLNTFLRDLVKLNPVAGPAGEEADRAWRAEILKNGSPFVRDVLLRGGDEATAPLEPIAERTRRFLLSSKDDRAQHLPAEIPAIEKHLYNGQPDRPDNYLEARNPHLYNDLMAFMSRKFEENPHAARTCIRVDELEKVGALLTGLRPAAVHTMIRNFMDPLIEGFSGVNPAMQARNAGSAFPGYIPMLGIGSVVTVLGLGLSSSSPPASSVASMEGARKTSNSTPSMPAVGAPISGASPEAPNSVMQGALQKNNGQTGGSQPPNSSAAAFNASYFA